MKSRRGAEGSSAAAEEVALRAPVALKKGPWMAAEDAILRECVKKHGEGNWNAVQTNHGLNCCGKSCRLRWTNHLRPNLKKGTFSRKEELLIIHFHAEIDNKWARMSTYLPGRTDNEIKNYWNTRLKKRQLGVLPPYTPEMHREFLLRHGYHIHPSVNSLLPLLSLLHLHLLFLLRSRPLPLPLSHPRCALPRSCCWSRSPSCPLLLRRRRLISRHPSLSLPRTNS